MILRRNKIPLHHKQTKRKGHKKKIPAPVLREPPEPMNKVYDLRSEDSREKGENVQLVSDERNKFILLISYHIYRKIFIGMENGKMKK